MSTKLRDNKPRAAPRRQVCCTTSLFVISAIGIVAMVSLFLFNTHLTGVSSSLLYKMEGKLGFIRRKAPAKSLVKKKTFLEMKPYGGGSLMVNASISRMKALQVFMPLVKSPLEPFRKRNGSFDIHFIHIPKCGGTSVTAVLREVACKIDGSRNNDCCTNPGYCDWAAKRRCRSIRGCTNHFPFRPWIFKKNLPSITILREPLERILSAWFYHGHNPNNDFFQVRPYFKEYREGIRPKCEFEEYVEMPEYQNVQTRMLGADSFPYRNITITNKVFQKAVEALERIYYVGVQEEYELSVQLMLRRLGVPLETKLKRERNQQKKRHVTREQTRIKANEALISRLKDVNIFDLHLYYLAFFRFCSDISLYPDLYSKLKEETKFKCKNIQL